MKLQEYIHVNKLQRHIANGVVTARRHNTLPLTIYCYGKKAVFDHIWDEVTTRTRGLIVADDGEIIARPYEKFFSVDQYPALLYEAVAEEQKGNYPVITEKVNGCLGIFWRYGIHWGIASKGSFHSPHAEFATKWMEEHIEHNGKLVFPDGYTPVFEVICQEIQPHVIKYKNDHLVLLSFVNIETGEELDIVDTANYASQNKIGYPWVYAIDLQTALAYDAEDLEGFVVTYNRLKQAPLKLKIKFPTFLKNCKKFYEEQKLRQMPEFSAEMISVRERVAVLVKEALTKCTTQKEFAEFFLSEENRAYAPACFAMLNYDEDKDRQQRAIRRIVDRQQTQ